MRFILGFLTALVLLAIAAAAPVYSGWYNVAAVEDLHPGLAWALHTTMERSVRQHAASIVPPDNLEALAPNGFEDFAEMCVQCHGAPGKEKSEVGKGLAPQAPNLVDAAPQWTPAQIFWIVKNGVHMTGMPAFGRTHDDQRLWAIVAFVSSLPSITAEKYEKMVAKIDGKGSQSDNHHEEHSHSDHDHH
jgi:mono/diheme cytochrome c family protein